MRYVIAFILATLTSPAAARDDIANDDERRSYHALNKCVLYAANKFAKLDSSVDGISAAALAACQVEFRLYSDAVGDSRSADARQAKLRDATEKMQELAVRTIAGRRLK